MSFLSKLIIDGKTYNVLECTYELNQSIDESGKPMGRPMGGQISLAIESDSDTDIFYWMKEPEQAKDGTITFYKRDAMAQQKMLQFTKGFCIHYKEQFIADDEAPMVTSLIISAEQIKLGSVDFKNLWGTVV